MWTKGLSRIFILVPVQKLSVIVWKSCRTFIRRWSVALTITLYFLWRSSCGKMYISIKYFFLTLTDINQPKWSFFKTPKMVYSQTWNLLVELMELWWTNHLRGKKAQSISWHKNKCYRIPESVKFPFSFFHETVLSKKIIIKKNNSVIIYERKGNVYLLNDFGVQIIHNYNIVKS